MKREESIPENCFGYAMRMLGVDVGGYVVPDKTDIKELFEEVTHEQAEAIYWLDGVPAPCHMAIIDPEDRSFVWQKACVGGEEQHKQLEKVPQTVNGYTKVFIRVKR